MKKIDLGQSISILANLGVLVGIVFLAIEVRQASNAVQSATLQAIGELSYNTSTRVVENPELRDALLATLDGDALTEEQQFLLLTSYMGMMRIQQIC